MNTANTAPMMYVSQQSAGVGGDELDCGELGNYGEQKTRTGHGEYDRDHIPSKAALKERARQLNRGRKLTSAQAAAVDKGALSIVIPKAAHRDVSPTYGGRNTEELVEEDADDLAGAAKRDTKDMLKEIDEHADSDCVKAYRKAAREINAKTNDDYDAFLRECLKVK
jgi:hypothetical protein